MKREIQLQVINHTGMDFRFTSETLPNGHLLLQIYRREQTPEKNGIVVVRDGPPQGLGVLQYDTTPRPRSSVRVEYPES